MPCRPIHRKKKPSKSHVMNSSMNETKQLDERATGLAKQYLRTEAELLEVLIQMRKKKVFAELNYATIFDYCEQRLKLSRAQSYYFQKVAEKSTVSTFTPRRAMASAVCPKPAPYSSAWSPGLRPLCLSIMPVAMKWSEAPSTAAGSRRR